MAGTLQIELPTQVIERLCRKYQVKELSVFGSALRPDFRDNSDIDLLVTFQPQTHIGLIAFLGFERELSEAFGRKVDLVPKNGLKPLVRDEILSQAQVLYAAWETLPRRHCRSGGCDHTIPRRTNEGEVLV